MNTQISGNDFSTGANVEINKFNLKAYNELIFA